jgi:hypothetical protein
MKIILKCIQHTFKFLASLFSKEENLETSKASTSKLPETISNKNEIPMIENPFKKVTIIIKMIFILKKK